MAPHGERSSQALDGEPPVGRVSAVTSPLGPANQTCRIDVEMPLPPHQLFVAPLLRVLLHRPEGLRTAAAHEAVATRLGLSDADKAELLPSGQQAAFRDRNGRAHDRLKRAGLSESSSFGTWRLTKTGRAFVQAHRNTLTDEATSPITHISEDNRAVL